jgi:hypothetical protein
LVGVSRIVSVNLAVPEPNPAKGVGVTGINKRPVDHLVTVRAPGPKPESVDPSSSSMIVDHSLSGGGRGVLSLLAFGRQLSLSSWSSGGRGWRC